MPVFRKVLTATAIAAPVLATGIAPALAGTHPHADEAAAARYDTWQNYRSNDYLHVKGASKSNSAVVNTYVGTGSCADHGSKDVQCAEEWQQISTNYANEFAYANANSGKCLDDGENAANVTPAQYTCGAYPANMRWIHGTFDFWNGGESIAYHNALYTAYGTKDRVLCANWQNPDSLFINNPSSSWAPGASNFCDWE